MFVPTGEVLTELYDELHRLASSFLRNERANHTLQPSALINETYLRMVSHGSIKPADHAHFLRLAARTMRQFLIDYARGKRAQKRIAPEAFDGDPSDNALPIEDYLTISNAIEKLSRVDPGLSSLVELRFFAGLTITETAEVMQTSEATVKREWAVARSWLRAECGLEDAAP